MIVIQSSADDAATQDVLDWMRYLRQDVPIADLYDTLPVDDLSLYIGDNGAAKNAVTVNGRRLDIGGIRSSWFRRGRFTMRADSKLPSWNRLAATENEDVLGLIDDLIYPGDRSINKFSDVLINKLKCLALAEKAGLLIPATLVTTAFTALLQFAREKQLIILKPIGTPFFKIACNERYNAHVVNKVSQVSHAQIERLGVLYPGDKMSTTCAQQYIEKKWEIRTVFLNNECYSMAIFSQQNEQTRIDFRNYDEERPNRCLPYSLPDTIVEKLRKLMLLLNINCGSIDMIYTPQKEYVFLEVNPVGQYGWLSTHCNYFIDKRIALLLLSRYDE